MKICIIAHKRGGKLVFSKWDQIFKDSMTTMAAVDRLVHHAIILEFGEE